jgi:hypothetical protein
VIFQTLTLPVIIHLLKSIVLGTLKRTARRFWWVIPIILMAVAAGWFWMLQSRTLIITWHDPRVRVEVLGVTKGLVHTPPYPGGIKGDLYRLLSQTRLASLVSTNKSNTIRTPGTRAVLWFAITPTSGKLIPDRDRVTIIRPNGRKTSWSNTQGEVVNKGEVYFRMVGIDEGLESVKGSTVEISGGSHKLAVIQIQ